MRQIFALVAILSAFILAAPVAFAAGTGKYCLKGPSSQSNCSFQTLAACTSAKKGTQTCALNPASTTGSGMSRSSKDSMKK